MGERIYVCAREKSCMSVSWETCTWEAFTLLYFVETLNRSSSGSVCGAPHLDDDVNFTLSPLKPLCPIGSAENAAVYIHVQSRTMMMIGFLTNSLSLCCSVRSSHSNSSSKFLLWLPVVMVYSCAWNANDTSIDSKLLCFFSSLHSAWRRCSQWIKLSLARTAAITCSDDSNCSPHRNDDEMTHNVFSTFSMREKRRSVRSSRRFPPEKKIHTIIISTCCQLPGDSRQMRCCSWSDEFQFRLSVVGKMNRSLQWIEQITSKRTNLPTSKCLTEPGASTAHSKGKMRVMNAHKHTSSSPPLPSSLHPPNALASNTLCVATERNEIGGYAHRKR